jgi:hypothetical protein
LGLRPEQLQELEQKGVIGKWADRRGPKPPDNWEGEGLVG